MHCLKLQFASCHFMHCLKLRFVSCHFMHCFKLRLRQIKACIVRSCVLRQSQSCGCMSSHALLNFAVASCQVMHCSKLWLRHVKSCSVQSCGCVILSHALFKVAGEDFCTKTHEKSTNLKYMCVLYIKRKKK